jgi:hypothetical protein
MKATFLFTFMLIVSQVSIGSAAKSGLDMGMLFMAGGRFDDMRLCVATGNGIQGGPVADIMLTIRKNITENLQFGADIPFFRPVLFGAAFKMLQFEPQMILDRTLLKSDKAFLLSPALGLSLHYGPDYKSDKKNRSDSFFAMGPLLGLRMGIQFSPFDQGFKNTIAIRPFYVGLFSKDYRNGNVAGATLEYLRNF